MKSNSSIFAGIGLCLALLAMPVAKASHFRGGAMIPSIDANGLLTVEVTSFWRTTSVSSVFPSSTAGGLSQISNSVDTSDSRFSVRNQTFTRQLNPNLGAQNIEISWDSCCRVGGIVNLNNSFNAGNSLRSTIAWDGSSATKPIDFNFNSIQVEVGRDQAYNDNPNAVSPNGNTIGYQASTPEDNFSDLPGYTTAPGFTMDPVSGNMNIPFASTQTYSDNTSTNPGADYVFAFDMTARDSSGATTGTVQADWLWDAVNTGSNINSAPTVADASVMAIVGDSVAHTFVATDPNLGDTLTWDAALFGVLGPLGGLAIAPVWNAATGELTWDTTGSALGTYIFQARVSDQGGLTDVGSFTVQVKNPPTNGVPDGGATLALLGLSLFSVLGLKKKIKN